MDQCPKLSHYDCAADDNTNKFHRFNFSSDPYLKSFSHIIVGTKTPLGPNDLSLLHSRTDVCETVEGNNKHPFSDHDWLIYIFFSNTVQYICSFVYFVVENY